MPLISVIVPAYNAEKTIQESVDSVLGQTFTDFELIVIDDGSTDGTLDILKDIPDPRLQVISQPNSGPPRARNHGVAVAQGDYFAFLDADDLWRPTKLADQLAALDAHPEAAIAYSWTDCIDETGAFVRRGGRFLSRGRIYPTLLLVDILENGSVPLIRRQAFMDVGGFDESLPAGQDWDLYLRLAVNHRFIAVPQVQVFYRMTSNSVSSNLDHLEQGAKQLLERAYQQAPPELCPLHRVSLGNLYKYLLFKALTGSPGRRQGLAAFRYLGMTLWYDPTLVKARVLLKVGLKATLSTLLPPQSTRKIYQVCPALFKIDALMGYIISDPQVCLSTSIHSSL